MLVLLYGLATRTFIPRTDPGREENPAELLGDVIQVEVRNGAGEAGLAGSVIQYLRRRGFDVVESGNYSSFDVDSTFIVDRVGNPDAARRVAAALGVSENKIQEDVQSNAYLDVSVVVGKDFNTLTPF